MTKWAGDHRNRSQLTNEGSEPQQELGQAMDEAVTRFRSVAVAWAPFARRKITTWLSILSGGNWHIRFARALFDDGTPHIKPLRVRTASFQAERRIELLAGNGADVLETVLLDPPRGLASDQVPGLPGASAPPMNGNFFAFGPPPQSLNPGSRPCCFLSHRRYRCSPLMKQR